MRTLILAALLGFTAPAFAGSASQCGVEAKPCVEYGATIFAERCALCHGSDGLGEGILSLSVPDYPNTNLLDNMKFEGPEKLHEVIAYGGGLEGVSPEMPPWGDELTATQLESVVMFNDQLRTDFDTAYALLQTANANVEPSIRAGRAIFAGRCSLCHGKYGLGDGKMSRIIKDPPPFNLTKSVMPPEYLTAMITNGGERMARSPRMPPFGGDLSESDIQSVVMFIQTLRASE